MADKLSDIFAVAPVIELDKPRKLHMGFLAWMRLEPLYGDFEGLWATIVRLVQSKGPVLEDVLQILWALCLEEAESKNETLTIPDVRRHLQIHRLQEYLALIRQAVAAAVPPQDPPQPGAQAVPGPGAGPTPGAPGTAVGAASGS